MIKINYKSDFKIKEKPTTVALEVPFIFSYYVFENKKYVASFDGSKYVNCERKEDGSLDVIFNNPGFGIGHLKVERKYAINDKAFSDGVYDVVSLDKTDVFITSGETSGNYVETLVVPPYLKGDKGDPMTWKTMTDGEREELVEDVVEAIGIDFDHTGDGTKFLSDDGTYKEIEASEYDDAELRNKIEENAKSIADNKTNVDKEISNLAKKSELESTDAKANRAISEASIAKNAVATLEGLANADEAMQTLASQVVQIEDNKQKISELGSTLIPKNEAITESQKICNIKTGEISIQYSYSIQIVEIDINRVKKVVMPSYWGSNSIGEYDGAAFFDKNMNHLGYVQGLLDETWEITLTEIPLNMIPLGTKYIVTTSGEFKDSVGYAECIGITEYLDELIINSKMAEGEIVLPKTLYNMVGKKNALYISQFCKSEGKANIKLAATGTELLYGNSILFQPQMRGVDYWSYIHLLEGGRIVSSHSATIKNIEAPSTQKNVKIMTIGDSLTDLGFYQSHLTRLLSEDNVSCKWVGTQHKSKYEPVSFEAKSGGGLSFFATDYNVAKIINVSGIVVPPSTGYGSTEYADENGNKWRISGHILTELNGIYSGQLRLVKYERDTNYEGGDAGDTTGRNLPSSGVLTKSNNGEGDNLINYNLVSTASENPLWNPQAKVVDWNYYFTTWGFDVPDIVIMQFGYNEVEGLAQKSDESVQISVQRLKTLIDKLHEQYPGIKIIVGLETYGADSVGYFNKDKNSAYPKKYGQLSLYREWMNAIEEYSYVIFAPVYARMDDIRGYGLTTEIAVNDNVYESPMKEIVRVNGYDGVHPPYDFGQKEIAMAYEPIIISMIQ